MKRLLTTSVGAASNTEYVYATNSATATAADDLQERLDRAVVKWGKLGLREQGVVLASAKTPIFLICALWSTLIDFHRDIIVRNGAIPSRFLLEHWNELTPEQQHICTVYHKQMFEQMPKENLPAFLVSPVSSVRRLARARYVLLTPDV